ncbi:flagellar basal-body MS-ring/collar protein FliF [Limisalsivibrio acetivorans]|uniref:flagellar basal-body MS-ring/collar protein FliF n=1 Tax=Limisalsivibrio acetivorans TaxID=1304888 RepID=UPI0003B4E615|nr:flagellar basal-body MS-ring/collar protein FliF [Limisalsivibrio acetivorans]
MALNDVVSQFRDIFNKLTLVQKISIGSAAGAVIITLAALLIWANRPVYKTLFANMTEDDAPAVVEKLKENNVPYRLKEGGATVEVPQEMVYETRLELAREGLPKGGGQGFELFDKSSYGMTEFLQDVNYQRALQGELSRTISSLNEIEEARVHLTIPKNKLFISEDESAKAAVVLKLAGSRLGQEQVKAIASLVAGSVKGLVNENVQIVDTNGRLLSDFLDTEDSPLMLTQTQLEYQKKIERSLELKLNDILGRTVGSGNAVARVTAEIDFSKRESTTEEFDPNPVLRSQQSLSVTSTNSPQTPQGVPGVESNLAEPEVLNNDANSEYEKAEETQNFEVGKKVTREQKAYGTIKRISVAVVVDDKKVTRTEGENEIVETQPRGEEELAAIRNLVAMAVGYNSNRGDQVEVSNISFDTTAESQEQVLLKREKTMELISTASKYAVAVIILILFYFLVIRRILKKMDKTVVYHEDGTVTVASGGHYDEGGLDVTVKDESGFPKTLEELEREVEQELDESAPMDVETVKTKVMVKKIEEFCEEDPEGAANIIKTMLKGG